MAQFDSGPVVFKTSVATLTCLAVFSVVRCHSTPVVTDSPKSTADPPAPDVIAWRIRQKTPIVRQVAAGRMSLIEAAARFGSVPLAELVAQIRPEERYGETSTGDERGKEIVEW